MYKPGSIRRITLHNFVTHTFVEVFPGPNLNMIVGPNGSGKSTIVAAIILGLGGTPKTIGRGTRVSEYVKHECDKASITLFLQGDTDDETIKIRRDIDFRDTSLWSINDRKATLKELTTYIEKYKIQVNNLCQFLPQDRVADFAKLNKQELLKQTLIALCKDDLLEKQQQLVVDKERIRYLETTLGDDQKKLQDLRDLNRALEGRVKNFNKRKKFLKELDAITRKELWVQYEISADEREKIKKDRETAQKMYQQHVNAAKPIEDKIAIAKRKLKSLTQVQNILSGEINTDQKNITDKQETVSNYQNRIKNVKEDTKRLVQDLERKQHDVKSSEMRLQQLLEGKKEILEQVDIEKENREKLLQKNREMEQKIVFLTSSLNPLHTQKSNAMYEITSLQNQKQSQERLREGRLSLLQRLDSNAYNAVLWLKDNQQMFRNHIFQPILLEVNVLNPQHALYIENSIGFRDKIAFICTDKDDMKLFLQNMRQQNLVVNVLFQDPHDVKPDADFPVEQLRRYGFDAYLESLISAPPPVLTSLCRRNNFHNTPVAFKDSADEVENVPWKVFYRGETKYVISRSKYTQAKSIRTTKIFSDKTITTNTDSTRLQDIDRQIGHLKQSIEPFQIEIQSIEDNVREIRAQKRKLLEEIEKLNRMPQEVMKLDQKISSTKERVREMKSQLHNCTVESIEQQQRDKCKRTFDKIGEILGALKDDYKVYTKKLLELQLEEQSSKACQSSIQALETEAEEVRLLVTKSERTLQHVTEALSEITRQLKTYLAKARAKCGGHAPDEPGFAPYQAQHEKLPASVGELNEQRDAINARLSCLSNLADANEMNQYEDRLERIETLEQRLEGERKEFDDLSVNMERKQSEWLEPLEDLVATINRGFSRAFQSMGCAGQVKVHKGDDEKDCEKYGISVSVTYRNGAPLQELNTITQSGGERAVATAAYMLSMQELTPVPFRCVDEINQGMDANNERRIFNLMVDVTCQEDTSQYFFITPKLVSNLKYDSSMKIHFVHNGLVRCSQKSVNENFDRRSCVGL